MQRSTFALALIILVTSMVAEPVQARAIRVDSGDWDNSGFLTGDSTQSIGFSFDFLGVASSSAQISANGSLSLNGGGETANLFPFFEPDQLGGGNTVQYQFGTTNASFSTAGVDAGFRVTWQVFDPVGALLNEFQLSLFGLSDGSFALEFNYNQLLFGDDGSQIGYSTSLGDSFDLLSAEGLSFANIDGVGDDGTPINCPSTPLALACNNYFAGVYGTDVAVMPNTAGGFFRQIDSNGDPVQGRVLFLSDATRVPEPSSLALLALGLLLVAATTRRRTHRGSHALS